ncbi:MAG: laccase domain-containing protein [Desulfovibrio sp.]|nr:laccase domain-containing protein [Desulfovibrio sp.]
MHLTTLAFQFPTLPHIHCCFTLKQPVEGDVFGFGNLSYDVSDDPKRVDAARACLLAQEKAHGLKALVEVHQVHGESLLFDPVGDCATQCADGLATREAGLGLLIKTADCQAILFTDRVGSCLMALHVGWRANRSGFIKKAVLALTQRYGVQPKDLLAVRGPSLSPLNAEFVHFDQEWGASFAPWFDPATKTMDLWGLTRAQLVDAGLLPRHIFGIDLCTMGNPHCYSYRREKQCGRQGGIIWRA